MGNPNPSGWPIVLRGPKACPYARIAEAREPSLLTVDGPRRLFLEAQRSFRDENPLHPSLGLVRPSPSGALASSVSLPLLAGRIERFCQGCQRYQSNGSITGPRNVSTGSGGGPPVQMLEIAWLMSAVFPAYRKFAKSGEPVPLPFSDSRYTRTLAKSAGVMPLTRLAWPRLVGRTRDSFSFAS